MWYAGFGADITVPQRGGGSLQKSHVRQFYSTYIRPRALFTIPCSGISVEVVDQCSPAQQKGSGLKMWGSGESQHLQAPAIFGLRP